ncbi:hypothetical protein O7607_07805 [Micromonospora sp. WMMA1949]|uniref:hypothetical protein n=1 Tax=unclassified Micromonospora TaxID=2617518 RepID=UPI0022B6D96D|nr:MULTISPECIES: hypothetical protein [unclassified Micromonospora]MCZ7425632.1 hypothetical protein [Micromonospora sp. WMMA1949]WBC10185.1 hypothetical protein O7604_04680 [Micromonospora sp. WMMA1947]
MTSPAEPASGDAAQASQLIKPLRELAALVLLGANAVLLFVGLLRLLVPVDYSTFSSRAGSTYFAFIGLEATVLPLLAVLIATVILPVVPKAKLITQVALVEYAVSVVFGALTFLIWLVGRLADGEVLDAFLGLLTRVAWLAIFGIAAFVVFKIWRTLYYVPKPKAQPGVYGQPQPGWPQQPGQGYPGAGGYPQQPGQGYPQAGSPPPGWPQQQPGPYGQPQSAPPFNTAPPHGPQSGPPSADPQAGSPYAGPQQAPQYGSPQSAPFGQPPSADPTQAIPRQSAEPGAPSPAADDERTQRFDREDPNQPR